MPKKGSKKKPTVAIIGAGIGGLTAAHELGERGFDVSIYEADAVIGGKAAIETFDSEHGLRRDHSIKNFSSYYLCMLETLKRIPYEGEESEKIVFDVFEGSHHEDNSAPATDSAGSKDAVEMKKANEKDDEKGPELSPKLNKKFKNTVFHNLVPYENIIINFPNGKTFHMDARLDRSIFHRYGEVQRFKRELRENGIEGHSFRHYVNKHIELIFMCEKRRRYRLENESYVKYIGFNLEQRPELKSLVCLVEIVAAAKIEGSANAAAEQALKMFGRFVNPHKLKSTLNLLNGPIDRRFLIPWANHIKKNLGGKIYTQTPIDRIEVDLEDGKKIKSLKTKDGKTIKADYYVMALSYSQMKFLITRSGLADTFSYIPEITTEAGEKWGHNCHFGLKKIPEGVPIGKVHVMVGSPWAIIYYYITNDFWKGEKHFPEDVPAQLWITTSSATQPGLKHNKPYDQCTEQEFKEELLFQARIPQEIQDLICCSVAGRGLNWLNTTTNTLSPQSPDGKQYVLTGEERKKKVNDETEIVCESPLYARDVSMKEIPTQTPFLNLFIAGECVKTTQLISTMEKANEGGKRCAAAILESEGKRYPTSQKFPTSHLPLNFMRTIDTFFFSLFHPSASRRLGRTDLPFEYGIVQSDRDKQKFASPASSSEKGKEKVDEKIEIEKKEEEKVEEKKEEEKVEEKKEEEEEKEEKTE